MEDAVGMSVEKNQVRWVWRYLKSYLLNKKTRRSEFEKFNYITHCDARRRFE